MKHSCKELIDLKIKEMRNYFLLITIFFNALLLLLGQDVCLIRRPQKKMATKENDHKCEKSFCQGNLSFNCSIDHCSINAKKCFEFFKSKLQTTNQTKTIEWNTTDICLNGKGCLIQKVIRMRSHTYHQILKTIDCPCTNNYNVSCSGEKYCALSKKHCDDFNLNLKKLGLEFKAAKCLNDGQIIKILKG